MKARWVLLALAVALAYPAVAAAKALTEVLVVNDDARPVPAKVLGTVQTSAPALERFIAQTEFLAPGGQNEVCGWEDRIAVPEGKRFVIESTTVQIREGATAPRLFLAGHGPHPFIDIHKLSDAVDTAGSDQLGSNDYWGGTSDQRLFAGPTKTFTVGEFGQAELQVIPCVITRGEDRYVRVQFNGYLEAAS